MADLSPSHLGADAAAALTANAAAGLAPPSLAAALTAGLGTAPASLATSLSSLGLPATGQTHPVGPGHSLAGPIVPESRLEGG
jgi:hypothetical protein